MDLKFHKTKTSTVFGAEMDVKTIDQWKPTIGGMREAIQRWHVTATDFSAIFPLDPLAARCMPTQREVEDVSEMAREAVAYGRVIDFGHLPNEVIMQGGNRGGPLWNAGGLGMPFREPWILYHTWEEGTGIYIVNLLDYDKPAGGDFEVCELQPFRIDGNDLLMICDRGIFDTVEGMLPEKKYHASVVPAQMRFHLDPEVSRQANNGKSPESAACGNIGDPVMTALLILNTRNIQRETIRVSEKLNRARKRSGKPLIPPYERINAAPYVTAILARGKARRGEGLGGHHASPTPHIRMGHIRQYASGVRSFVRDTLVNVNDATRAEFLRTRSHYAVPPDKP